MKHVRTISMAKVAGIPGQDIQSILEQVFGFVMDLVEQKGKVIPAE